MYEFPSSPAVGDVANGYRYDGVGWGGGPAVPTPTEQFFNVSGGASFDILIPSWATGVQLIGSCYTPNISCNVLMRVSADGTNFFSGASDYTTSGPVHNTGSTGYGNVPAAASAFLYLSAGADQGHLVPHMFTAEMSVVRPSTAVPFTQKAYAKNYDVAATTSHRTFWHEGWLGSIATTSLALKAIRVYTTAGVFGAGSWLKVNWIGGQVPQANGLVSEAPMDGNEYTRINGVWRLKRQEFNWTASIQDIPVPAWGPRRCTLNYFMGKAAAGLTAIGLRTSTDGTTFFAGATDYMYSGIFGQGAAVSFQGVTGGTFAYLSFDGDNTTVGYQGTFEIEVKTMSNSALLYRGFSTTYNNLAGVLFRDMMMGGWLQGTNFKALRVFTSTGIVPTAGSYVSAEWS